MDRRTFACGLAGALTLPWTAARARPRVKCHSAQSVPPLSQITQAQTREERYDRQG